MLIIDDIFVTIQILDELTIDIIFSNTNEIKFIN